MKKLCILITFFKTLPLWGMENYQAEKQANFHNEESFQSLNNSGVENVKEQSGQSYGASWDNLAPQIKQYVLSFVIGSQDPLKAVKAFKVIRSINKNSYAITAPGCYLSNLLIKKLRCAPKEIRETLFRGFCGANDKFFMKKLYKTKIDVLATNYKGETALVKAAKIGNSDTIKWLWRKKGCDNYANFQQALLVASSNDKLENVAQLLSLNALQLDGDPKLFSAIINKDSKLVETMLKSKIDVNQNIKEGYTPLIFAANNNAIDIVRLLLEAKANVNAKANNEVTALMVASDNGHKEIARILIKHHADVNAKANNGVTPLMFACQNGHTQIARLLINNNADVNAKDNTGLTALMLAADNGHTQVVRLLINYNADVNAKDDNGVTALMGASENGHMQTAQFLINHNADVNAKDNTGLTALMLAADNGHTQIVRLLINYNAAKDNNGLTALIVDSDYSHMQDEQLLIKHNANTKLNEENLISKIGSKDTKKNAKKSNQKNKNKKNRRKRIKQTHIKGDKQEELQERQSLQDDIVSKAIRIKYDRRIWRWFCKEFIKAENADWYTVFYHTYPLIVDTFALNPEYGYKSKYKNQTYGNRWDDTYTVIGEIEYKDHENKTIKKRAAFKICFGKDNRCYHRGVEILRKNNLVKKIGANGFKYGLSYLRNDNNFIVKLMNAKRQEEIYKEAKWLERNGCIEINDKRNHVIIRLEKK